MKRLRWLLYPALIYFIGLGFVLHYTFTTNYIDVVDSCRDYQLYLWTIQKGYWRTLADNLEEGYALQSACLATTLVPALAYKLTGITPMILFKVYHALIFPFLPVGVYLIAKKFVTNPYAFLTGLFFIGQVCFLQSPAFGRTNAALLPFTLAILVVLKPRLNNKAKVPIIGVLSLGIVLSHYGTAYISLILVGVGWFIIQLRQSIKKLVSPYKTSLLVLSISLLVCMTGWYGFVTKAPLSSGVSAVTGVVDALTGAIETFKPASTSNSTEANKPHPFFNLSSRDKITQAAFGIKNPDGDTVFQFNWGTFSFAWLTVGFMSYGLLDSLRKRSLPFGYLALSVISYALIVTVVLVSNLGRVYGIERTYYQALIMLAPFFVIGGQRIAKKLRLEPFIVILLVLTPYIYFIATTGIIHSAAG